jgi:putative aminopeptidase FrvX
VKSPRPFWMCCITLLTCAALAPAQLPQTLKESFIQCAGYQAVTGREARFIEFIKGRLPQGVKSEIDNMGNLTVQFGDAAPQLLVIASVDEPGFVVTGITDEGYLRVASPGGRTPSPLFIQFHEGHYVDIATKSGTIRGVVALPSSHLVRGRRESLSLDRFLIDIGARSKQEAMARGVEMLDPAAAVKDIASLAENRIAGPMLSRKLGAFALLEALKDYAPRAGKGVVFAWSTQSAMSNSGAGRLARRFAARQVLIVGAFQRAGTRSGRDPVEILDSGVLIPDSESPGGGSQWLRAAVASASTRVKLTPSPTAAPPEARPFGTNADAVSVGISVVYPGSLVETIDADDLQQLIEFIKIIVAM